MSVPYDNNNPNLNQERINKRKKARQQRIKRLIITGLVILALIIAATAVVVVNCISDKEELREQGIAEFERGNYEKAEEYFQNSLNEKQWFSSSMDVDTRVYIAESALKRGDYPRAIELFTDLRDGENKYSNKDFLDGRIEFADAMDTFINKKDYTSAAGKLENLIAKGDTSLNIYLGACYANSGDAEKMMDSFNKYTDEYGMNSYVASQLASYYVGIGDNATAADYIQQGIYSGDDDYMYLLQYNQAVILERQRDYEGAFAIMSELHTVYPDNPDFEKEYDFLYSRINVDETPVHEAEKSEYDEY
jgi:hypothetical protein